jgi:predicted MPP superfamily phosphohydrolase
VQRRPLITRWFGRHWARFSYARFVEPFWLEHNSHDLRILGLDPRLDGLRVLHLTDFHACRRVPTSHLRQAIDRGRQVGCDIVALTGDFVHAGFHYVDTIAQLVGQIQAPMGVYAVLGNHDYSVRIYGGRPTYPRLPAAVEAALASVGVKVLKNEHQILHYGGAPIAVAGVCDLWSGQADLPRALQDVDPNTPRIVLAHNPRTIDQASQQRCDLVLSGHTHGGQVEIEKFAPRFWVRFKSRLHAGLYHHDTGYLYVNKGIGYTVRFRFQVRPEIAVFTLRRWQQSGDLNVL